MPSPSSRPRRVAAVPRLLSAAAPLIEEKCPSLQVTPCHDSPRTARQRHRTLSPATHPTQSSRSTMPEARAVLYCRVSTREQAETGHSLEAQAELLRNYAKQKGLSVVDVIAVPESASGRKERVHFGQMLKTCRKERISHILTEKVDRISRNFKEAIRLQDFLEEDASRSLHFVKQSLVIGKPQQVFGYLHVGHLPLNGQTVLS